MLKPLSRELNQVILALAPAYEAKSFAPGTFPELMRCPSRIVWDGASDATIYADPRVNHAFRAWHDAEHVRGAFDFSLTGERATCEAQIRGLLARFPRVPSFFLAIIRAEITGQAEHFARFGEFPADQAAFIREAIANAV